MKKLRVDVQGTIVNTYHIEVPNNATFAQVEQIVEEKINEEGIMPKYQEVYDLELIETTEID